MRELDERIVLQAPVRVFECSSVLVVGVRLRRMPHSLTIYRLIVSIK